MFDLKDKVALITGGASGIGFAYAKELLRNQLKAVALIDIHVINGEQAVSEIMKEFGKGRAIFVQADVGDRIQFKKAFETTVKAFNQLDIVINNAGIIQEIQWEKCVGVNLTGAITGCMLAMDKYLPTYKSGPEAVILNTTSLAGLDPLQELPTYSATKAGIIGLTRSLGGDIRYQNTKVRVVAVCPGGVATSILQVNANIVNEPYLSTVSKLFQGAALAKPEDLAKHVIGLIREAPNGSIWHTARAKNCTKVEFSNYLS